MQDQKQGLLDILAASGEFKTDDSEKVHFILSDWASRHSSSGF